MEQPEDIAPAPEPTEEADAPLDLTTVFINENGREYDVRISVAVAHGFCRQNKIKLEGLQPLLLDIGQILDLAFMATRSSKYTALGETKAQFLEGLEGESFNKVQECTVSALVNFTLKTLPKKAARVMREEIRRQDKLAKDAAGLQASVADHGPGETSTESAGVSEQTPEPQDAP